jgi:hypothetical protein
MSFLSAAGKFFKTLLHIGEEAAVVAKPFIVAAFPEIAPLYTSALGTFIAAETAVQQVQGAGAQKLSISVQTLLPIAQKFAVDNNIAWPEEDIKKWASALVDTLNLIPAPQPKSVADMAAAIQQRATSGLVAGVAHGLNSGTANK